MEKQIGDALIKRNIVHADTEIEAWYKAVEFGGGTFDQKGFFTISEIEKKDNGSVCFHARSNVDGKWYDFNYSNIIAIDGMEPEKLANAYGIKLPKVNKNINKK
tara:strand:+ start:205 stop:516 length:312 start_codon:yes stop_codon:yes gene_type:complete